MKVASIGLGLLGGILASEILIAGASAQINPDGTLKTTVSQSGNHFTITNGSAAGSNLFHSFQQFSVPTGGIATFDLGNTPNISTIFSRVTGGSISNIDGLIDTLHSNNAVSLFLLNPSGIMFGPNAKLNLGGSFVATTANSVTFADGFKFNATETTSPSLLTVSVPVGLQLGTNAGAIGMQGIPAANFLFRPPQVFQAESVAFVGSQLNFKDASLSVPDGRVELWALRNGEVAVADPRGWRLSSDRTTADWGTISLRQSSFIDTSGKNGGAINIRGRGLTLQDGSGISSATRSLGQGQGIHVKTTEFVDSLGASVAGNYPTPGIFTSVFGEQGKGGDITIETQRLRILNGGWLQAIITAGFDPITQKVITSNNSRSGNITVKASDIEVRGYNPFPSIFTGASEPSSITTLIQVGQNNQSGKITLEADRIRVVEGARISADLASSRFGGANSMISGISGDVSIRAESLEISGVTPSGASSGILSSIQPFTQGQGGNITINTRRLQVSNGGVISSGVSGTGKAGNIRIDAQEVAVSDPAIDRFSGAISGINVAVTKDANGQGGNLTLNAANLHVFNGGQITSSSLGKGIAGNINLQVNHIEVQGISQPLPDGRQLPSSITASSTTASAAGSVNIIADTLRASDRAEIAVSNSGTGDAGNLNIAARNIFLDNGASLRAEVNGGSQGNIRLQARDVLLLRHGSNITTNAQGTSTGGNIQIQANTIATLPQDNSDIDANAVLGSGGNIQIESQTLLGFSNNNQSTSESNITATSQFGVSGTVQINQFNVNPTSGLVTLPSQPLDPSQQIVTGCGDSRGSRFVVTGRGGVPPNPTQQVADDRTWDDVRDLSGYRKTQATTTPAEPKTEIPLREASTWVRRADGKVELIATQSPTKLQTPVTCGGVSSYSGVSTH